MKSFKAFFIAAILTFPSLVFGQTSVNAATCNVADVNAVINGPTHVAVNGDTINIPSGTCTWTSGITMSGIAISIIGHGTPNTGASTTGAGASTTNIIQNTNSSLFSASNIPFGQTMRYSLMNFAPNSGLTTEAPPLENSGICTSSGCPNIRVDNITFDGAYNNDPADADTISNNLFGVYDHNTANNSSGGVGPALVQISHSSWKGIGSFGDESWTDSDTFGTSQNLFIENNLLNNARGTENDVGFNGIGGDRVVVRYNTHNTSGQTLAFTHGTAWGGRTRGERQKEVYRNTITCSSGCDSVITVWSGTAYVFQNTATVVSSGFYNKLTSMDVPRSWRSGPVWDWCTGSGVWDQNDGITYDSGVVTTGGTASMADSSKSWTTNQWAGSAITAGTPYSINDSSASIQFGFEIASNTSNSATAAEDMIFNTINAGDSYQIKRATLCLDQPGRSGGTYISGTSGPNGGPTPTGYPNQTLDPVYEWADITPTFVPAVAVKGARLLQNRDWYQEVAQTANSSPTSPFNGTVGTGFGTLSNRPSSCTSGVAYWATDQGNWNNSGLGGQGALYKCTSPNTWSLSYTPYAYPHPLTISGGSGTTPSAPTSLIGAIN